MGTAATQKAAYRLMGEMADAWPENSVEGIVKQGEDTP